MKRIIVLVLLVVLSACSGEVANPDETENINLNPSSCVFESGLINYDYEILTQEMIDSFSVFTSYLCETIDTSSENRLGFEYPSRTLAEFVILEDTYKLKVELAANDVDLNDIVIRILYENEGVTVAEEYYRLDTDEVNALVSSIENSDYRD